MAHDLDIHLIKRWGKMHSPRVFAALTPRTCISIYRIFEPNPRSLEYQPREQQQGGDRRSFMNADVDLSQMINIHAEIP